MKIKIIRPNPKQKIFVKRFHIYDDRNLSDPEVIEMNELLKNNPTYEKVSWQQCGPCSNWGYDVLRLETDEEYNKRLKNGCIK